MKKVKIILLMAAMILSLTSCLTMAAAGAGAAGGYYCGKTDKCMR